MTMNQNYDLPHPGWLAGLAALASKLVPPILGALIMVALDVPKSRKEFAARIFVAISCSYLFGDTILDFLHGFSWFAFLNPQIHAHTTTIDSLVGATAYFVMSGVAVLLRRGATDPLGTLKEVKNDAN